MGLLQDYLAKLKREKEYKKIQKEITSQDNEEQQDYQDSERTKVFQREFQKEKRRAFLE